jgi:predicted AlkP superfamily phosphohydrolase/phosphomutase
MSGKGARHLLIGFDGASLDLVRAFGAEALPVLHRCIARGASARLQSVLPPATLPNWASLLTGHDPGVHGIFDFTTRSGYRVQFTAGSIRASETLIARLDRSGQRCACLFFPGTFPPEQLARGVYISGWDAPVAFEADASFVWPRALYDEIVRRFGPTRFDDVNEFDADAPGWHAQLPAALCARIARRVELARWLLSRDRYDLFAIYFGESDTASHHLWSLHDPGSPRRPSHVSAEAQAGLLRVYQALDRALGELLEAAGGDEVELTIVSDHGSGGASDKVLYLNRALETAGLLRFHSSALGGRALGLAKDAALRHLPPKLRERLFRGFGAVLPGLIESRARFAAIDMRGTRVFSDELNYFPALHYNLRGREPHGLLEPADVPQLRRELEAALYALRDPFDGSPVVSRVHAREELFRGPLLARAPDLLLELALDRGYSYNLMPSAGAPPGTGAFRRLARDEWLGRKGRSLAGSHRDRGLFIAQGPSVRAAGEIPAHMLDVGPTLLARMALPCPEDLTGRVLPILHDDQQLSPADLPAPLMAATTSASAASAEVEARLRRLGYVE